jgi:hypothetical protein
MKQTPYIFTSGKLVPQPEKKLIDFAPPTIDADAYVKGLKEYQEYLKELESQSLEAEELKGKLQEGQTYLPDVDFRKVCGNDREDGGPLRCKSNSCEYIECPFIAVPITAEKSGEGKPDWYNAIKSKMDALTETDWIRIADEILESHNKRKQGEPAQSVSAESDMNEELNFISPIVRSKEFDLGFKTGYCVGKNKPSPSSQVQPEEARLEAFAKWFNETQWKGGKGDNLKGLFVKCDYAAIVKEFLTSK